MPSSPLTHILIPATGKEPTAERPVRLIARDLEASELLAAHSHAWGQVTYALDGVMRVTVANSTWIVPPMRAIWIPPHVMHEAASIERAQLRTIFVHAEVAPFKDSHCQVLDVSPLLRELIVALSLVGADEPRERMISALFLDELARSPTLPIKVALPSDKRLKALCETLIADPASQMTLDEWAKHAGASARTLARLFERDLGMSFGQWRQQVRLAHAAPLIARGLPLSRVAAELGYTSQSAFSAMFKKTFGQSPSAFFTQKEL
jgi:AraC-like DNA-binding protein/quercetin dioxygenase-like cupin family protein